MRSRAQEETVASVAARAGLPPGVRERLEDIYRDVDREVESLGAACWARGDCCDFERSGHRLHATWIEVAHVREKHPGGLDPASRLCPFWREGKCTERERRPLGCRTHFCDTRYRDQLEAIHERHLGRIRAIAREQSLPWDYGEFVKAIRSPDAGAAPGEVSSDSKERPVRSPGLQKTKERPTDTAAPRGAREPPAFGEGHS